jgi:6,7-dimethyl-8-ribityllumazine synthase
VMRVSLDLDKPIGFGVLTVENIEQAVARSGVAGSKEDKGYDSAIAALDLLRVKRELFDRFAK